MSFDALGLMPELLRAVADEGYDTPTPVQQAAIPAVLAGRDVLAGAQTGTGKTAAFVLPILQRLHATRAPGARREPVRVLVVVPTRELAIQVEESVRVYGTRRPVRSAAIYGGVGFGPQVSRLRAGAEIVVATPGRLLDHAAQRTVDLSRVEILVLDEADRLLDMGFIRDIRKILALLPARRQNLLFSATFSDEVRSLADGLLHRPEQVQVTPRNTTAELVEQVVMPVDRERKRDLLRELVASGRIRQALVFTRTKHGANRLAQQLERDGIPAAAIHGNRSQSQRVRALEDFKSGRVGILVATDIAARGLDIELLPHVVNFELPMVAEDYVHRIGRTGRAGAGGEAISLVCVDEAPLLRAIQALLGRQVRSEVVPGYAPDRAIPAEPIRLRSAAPKAGAGAHTREGGHARGEAPGRGSGPRPAAVGGGGRRPARGAPGPARTREAQPAGGRVPGTGFGHGRPVAPGPGRLAAPAHGRAGAPAVARHAPEGGPRVLPGERLARIRA